MKIDPTIIVAVIGAVATVTVTILKWRLDKLSDNNKKSENIRNSRLIEGIENLSHCNLLLLKLILESKYGLYINDLTSHRDLGRVRRSEIYYRTKELEKRGYVEIRQMTDHFITLSPNFKKLLQNVENIQKVQIYLKKGIQK